MIDFEQLRLATAASGLPFDPALLADAAAEKLEARPHGDLGRWRGLVAALPGAEPSLIDLGNDMPRIGAPQDLAPGAHERLRDALAGLKPWRKGPFDLFGCRIDSEWRSDFKWRRLAPHIRSLEGARVLDVGCGNGYHCWRMRAAGARLVIGADPGQINLAQFAAIKRYLPVEPVFLLPLADRELPHECGGFDTVFSMGVLHHSRDPVTHLHHLFRLLRDGGELVLETLVIEDDARDMLIPGGRYAKMRNVWVIPTPATAIAWLEQTGLAEVRLIDLNRTTREEQRRTEWMEFESLADFLDPTDPTRTIEGHPAPVRALIVARKGQTNQSDG